MTRGALSYYKKTAAVFFDLSDDTRGDFQPDVYVQTHSEYLKVHRALRLSSASGARSATWSSRNTRIKDFREFERFFTGLFRRIAHHAGLTNLSFDDDKIRAAAKLFLALGISMTFTRSGKPLPVLHMCVSVHMGLILAFCLETQGTRFLSHLQTLFAPSSQAMIVFVFPYGTLVRDLCARACFTFQ